jgi:hypothetical protein
LYHVEEGQLATSDVKAVVRLTEMTIEAMVLIALMGEDNNVLENVVATSHWFWMLL